MARELNSFPLHADLPEGLKLAFLQEEMTPLSLQLAAFLIENDRLEKNDLLLERALRISNEWDLYACALALRNGAYPGIYVRATGKSLVASLIDSFPDLNEDTLVWRLLVILVLSGLETGRAAFLREDSPTIKEYWTQKLTLPLPTGSGSVRAKDRFYFLYLVGKERELPERPLTEWEARFCIKSRTLRSGVDLSNVVNRVESDSIVAIRALTFDNEAAFSVYIEQGGLPSYALTNQLCLLASSVTITGSLWENVLLQAVSQGLELDEHQYQICKRKNSFAKQLKAAYEVPYWKKFFGVRDQRSQREGTSAGEFFGVRDQVERIPDRIDDCLVALSGRDYDLALEAMRESIANYAKAGAKERKRILGEELLMPVYYVDYTYKGEMQRITSPDYHRLEKLPFYSALPSYAKEKVARKVEVRIRMLRSRQLSGIQPQTKEAILDDIIRNDKIGNEVSDSKIAFYYSYFGASPDLKKPLHEIYEAELTEEHRRVTMAYLFCEKLSEEAINLR